MDRFRTNFCVLLVTIFACGSATVLPGCRCTCRGTGVESLVPNPSSIPKEVESLQAPDSTLLPPNPGIEPPIPPSPLPGPESKGQGIQESSSEPQARGRLKQWSDRLALRSMTPASPLPPVRAGRHAASVPHGPNGTSAVTAPRFAEGPTATMADDSPPRMIDSVKNSATYLHVPQLLATGAKSISRLTNPKSVPQTFDVTEHDDTPENELGGPEIVPSQALPSVRSGVIENWPHRSRPSEDWQSSPSASPLQLAVPSKAPEQDDEPLFGSEEQLESDEFDAEAGSPLLLPPAN